MSYTGLVHWHAGEHSRPSRPTVRQLDRVSAPRVARWDAHEAAVGRSREGGAAPSYWGLAGRYAAALTAVEEQEPTRAVATVALPSLPHAA